MRRGGENRLPADKERTKRHKHSHHGASSLENVDNTIPTRRCKKKSLNELRRRRKQTAVSSSCALSLSAHVQKGRQEIKDRWRTKKGPSLLPSLLGVANVELCVQKRDPAQIFNRARRPPLQIILHPHPTLSFLFFWPAAGIVRRPGKEAIGRIFTSSPRPLASQPKRMDGWDGMNSVGRK